MKNVLIVEDHNTTRKLLAEIVRAAISNEVEIQEAATFNQAKKILDQQEFNLALVDIGLPDGSGIDLAELLTERAPNTFVVITTIFDDDDHIFGALRAGVGGYLLKEQPKAELIEQLSGILKGRPPISPLVARKMLRYFHKLDNSPRKQLLEFESLRQLSGVPDDLSNLEIAVLVLVGEGNTFPEIANRLGISQNTVGKHIKSIAHKLNLHLLSGMVL